jgi:hypothetical protein
MAPGGAAIDEQDLERALLRKSVGTLAGGRESCADCGRTPLIGETVHRYADMTVCELCRPLRRGEPEHSEPVRHGEHGQTVRIHRIDAAWPPEGAPE